MYQTLCKGLAAKSKTNSPYLQQVCSQAGLRPRQLHGIDDSERGRIECHGDI